MLERVLIVVLFCGLCFTNRVRADEPSEEAPSPFLDGLDWQVMASGFYLFNTHLVAGHYNELDYPYTGYMGFGVNFVGGDVSYSREKFAVTIGFRWGTAASQLSALAPLKQGFVRWIPIPKLALDFGWFDTIYGAEFHDEWQNPTFTHGALYYLRQPFNHMGLRITATLSERVALKFLVVNESVSVAKIGGTPVDFDTTPALGTQLDISLADVLNLQIGYLSGASGSNGNRAWGQFFDLILSAELERFTLTFNGNATIDPPVNHGQYALGAAVSGDVRVHDHWRVGARVEYIGGTVGLPEGKDPDLLTITATLRYMPVQYLVISLEPRFERSQQALYFTRSSSTDPSTGDPIADSRTYFGLVLGVSAHLGNR